MPLTDKLFTYNTFIHDLLEANKATLGIADVYYGDQNRIPRTPTACVDPGEKRRTLNGAPRRTQVDMICYILLYHNPIAGGETVNRTSDQLAEAIETKIHETPQMGSIVIDSMVTVIEYGYQAKKNTLYRVSRLTVEGRSQVQLPSAV